MTGRGEYKGVAALILIYVASRVLLVAAGMSGFVLLPSGREFSAGNVQRPWAGPRPLEMWARWDSEWYLLIAERGYHLEDRMSGRRVAYEPADATGFFPLYPILTREVARGLEWIPAVRAIATTPFSPRDPTDTTPRGASLLLAGILVSNAALLGSLLVLLHRARGAGSSGSRRGAEPSGAGGPDRAAMFACVALLFFPPSLFLSAVYAESLLLFLTILCFRLLSDRRWLAAAVAGALASATKPTGLLLIVPAVLTMARARVDHPQGSRESWLAPWVTLPLYGAGAAGFSLYCGTAFGDPLSWLNRQDRWRGPLSGPWRAFTRWAESPRLHGSHGSTVELVFAIFVLTLLLISLWRRPAAEGILAALVAVPPLCATLWSYGRLSLQAFPIFITLGEALARRPKLAAAYVAIGGAGSAVLMAYFAAGYWAG
ncbi:MAG: hypothetical protein HY049_02640 [Acidobacteria bacterium]|nr:hypothetical protein [Acidobacteriota bacterium]